MLRVCRASGCTAPKTSSLGWRAGRATKKSGRALPETILKGDGKCGLAPIIKGLEKWDDISDAAHVLVALRTSCEEVLECTRFYHIMNHLEPWQSMERAYELLEIWWFLVTGDDEPRPGVNYSLRTSWSDVAKITTFSELAEAGGWGEVDSEEEGWGEEDSEEEDEDGEEEDE